MVEDGRDLLRSSSPISVLKQLHVVLDWVLCISTDEDSTNCMSKILKCLIFLTKKQKQKQNSRLLSFCTEMFMKSSDLRLVKTYFVIINHRAKSMKISKRIFQQCWKAAYFGTNLVNCFLCDKRR